MADKLVFDLSQEIEGSPQVFIKKDWLNILDNMNTNYSANQTIIDTSQLSNSNRYMSYREAYLAVPLLLSLTTSTNYVEPVTGTEQTGFLAADGRADYVMGLKNWFGSIIHSFTLDMNGTTIIQQTPLINMVNCFRLMTSLSWNDIITQGSTIGFYPDSPTSFSISQTPTTATANAGAGASFGVGVCNNSLYPIMKSSSTTITAELVNNTDADAFQSYSWINSANQEANQYNRQQGNVGLLKRIQNINFDPQAQAGGSGVSASNQQISANPTYYSQLIAGGASSTGSTSLTTLWANYISTRTGAVGAKGVVQVSVMATIYLKHIHNFFAMCPLMKGTFFKMTAFLNNSSASFTISGKTSFAAAGTLDLPGVYSNLAVNVPVGGVCPLMLTDATSFFGGASALGNGNYIASVAVGNKCLNQTQITQGALNGQTGQSIYLYVPAYTFNPVFEDAYLSSPVKSIKYSDYYQYQVINVGAGVQFNNLLTNGIANIKSVLIMPNYSSTGTGGAVASGLPAGLPVYQSPFDPAGAGMTSPFCLFTNFNVVISGQNSIYNTERYLLEQYNNQFKGCNAVNGDMTDGLTSGLINTLGFQTSQCFWYVNVARMLPVEESVPKSVQIIGTNLSAFALDLICFIEYGVSVDIDALTGARV